MVGAFQEATRKQIAYRAKLRRLEQQVGSLERQALRRARSLLRSVQEEVLAELRNLPPERFRAFFLREIQSSLREKIEALRPRLQQEIEQDIAAALDLGKQAVDEPLAVFNIQTPFADIPQELAEVVQGFSADLVTRLTSDLRQRIGMDISVSILRGDSVLDAARRIGRTLDLPGTSFGNIANRAETIARTEVLRAFSVAQQARLRQTAEVVPGMLKQWVATLDARTRPEHLSAHGQLVPWDEPFTVGGEQLMYPRDPGGSASNTINCRCVHVPVTPEVEEEAKQLAPPQRSGG